MRPTIGITSGDPAGIGLEVILKALPHTLDSARWVLFTTRNTFQRNAPAIPHRWIHTLTKNDLAALDDNGSPRCPCH